MNYYVFQSKFFIVFVAIAAMAFAALPFMKHSFSDTSDTYIRSQMDRISGEMLFIERRAGVFDHTCTKGAIGNILNDVIQEYGRSTVCRTNPPKNSEMIVYTQLHSGEYYCVDSLGVSCEISYEPKKGFRCKDL